VDKEEEQEEEEGLGIGIWILDPVCCLVFFFFTLRSGYL
jgi:hypothetical protein